MKELSKSKRLIELMLTVNQKRKFTVKELAKMFDVSSRTILRDLQELSEIGVPLYSEVGPHGGYQVLRESVLPPISFTEEEAFAMFFGNHALRHYSSLPFESETASALSKFYYNMPSAVRDRIDQMKNRVDFVSPTRIQKTPYLYTLMEAAINQVVLRITYESMSGHSSRLIQPIGIYSSNGFWYCPAYCFLREDFRVFRCDRIDSISGASEETVTPLALAHVHLGNWEDFVKEKPICVPLVVELTKEGVKRCETEFWSPDKIVVHHDGTGSIHDEIPLSELSFFTKFFIGLGNEATVKEPAELINSMTELLTTIAKKYALRKI